MEDGSPDDGRTLATLHQLQQHHGYRIPIEVIPLGRNFGPSVARNTGWDAATQPYIAFLDADDAWHPRKLEIQHDWMRDHPDVAMTGHAWLLAQSSKPSATLPEQWSVRRISPRKQLLSNRFSTPTVMMRRNLPYRFRETNWFSQDSDLWLSVVLDGHSAWRLELPLALIYKAPYGKGGLSGNLWRSEKSQLNTYWWQVREGRLRGIAFALLVPWLLAKFMRRVVITGLRDRMPGQ